MKLKTRRIAVLTDDQTPLVAGGATVKVARTKGGTGKAGRLMANDTDGGGAPTECCPSSGPDSEACLTNQGTCT